MPGFSKLIPTKSELLRLKKRLKFLDKGHDLLELKAETILNQIKKFYRTVRERRVEVMKEVIKAFDDLKKAEVVSGEHALEILADVNSDLIDYVINIDYTSSFGFNVPKLSFIIDREKHYPHYGFMDTSLFLDNYYKQIQKGIDDLIEYAELETTLFIMAEEYKKTRRRVNALEQIIIPQTKSQIKLVENMLEEMEMEEFTRMKKIKSKIISQET